MNFKVPNQTAIVKSEFHMAVLLRIHFSCYLTLCRFVWVCVFVRACRSRSFKGTKCFLWQGWSSPFSCSASPLNMTSLFSTKMWKNTALGPRWMKSPILDWFSYSEGTVVLLKLMSPKERRPTVQDAGRFSVNLVHAALRSFQHNRPYNHDCNVVTCIHSSTQTIWKTFFFSTKKNYVKMHVFIYC